MAPGSCFNEAKLVSQKLVFGADSLLHRGQGGGRTQSQGEVQMVLSEQERKRAFDVSRMQTELFTAFMANVHEGSIRVAQPSLGSERLASWP